MDYVDRNLYCDIGCRYEDSVGFCALSRDKEVPEDALCKHKIFICKPIPKDIIPDRLQKKKVKEYGIV